MKKSLVVSIGVGVFVIALSMMSVLLKLLLLQKTAYHDEVRVLGLPIARLDNDATGFGLETKPGLIILGLLSGLVAYAVFFAVGRRHQVKKD